MLVAYEWGRRILEMFRILEDFLLQQPFEGAVKANRFGQMLFSGCDWPPDWWPFKMGSLPTEFLEALENLSLAEILFSSFIIAIIIFKIFKFVVGFITGS